MYMRRCINFVLGSISGGSNIFSNFKSLFLLLTINEETPSSSPEKSRVNKSGIAKNSIGIKNVG